MMARVSMLFRTGIQGCEPFWQQMTSCAMRGIQMRVLPLIASDSRILQQPRRQYVAPEPDEELLPRFKG